MYAFNAFEQQRFGEAVAAWEMMLKLLPPANDTRRAVIERSIAQAMQHLSPRRVNKKWPDGDAIGLCAPRCCRNRMVAATRERTLSYAAVRIWTFTVTRKC